MPSSVNMKLSYTISDTTQCLRHVDSDKFSIGLRENLHLSEQAVGNDVEYTRTGIWATWNPGQLVMQPHKIINLQHYFVIFSNIFHE